MNRQEEQFFKALSKDRSESADMLEKPSMRGIKNSVVEKYSDQAHFIYELLQNADDARATSVRFVLEPDRLVFAHNGTRHFSVSDPAKEDSDSQAGLLGDVNSITSIANSNKIKKETSIGKFGVGFKAVFQYTSTPHVYDPEFRFRIDRFIVPILLENDFSGREPEETLFVFPFDHPEKSRAEACDDISDKLQNLTYPLLFLSHIRCINIKIKKSICSYDKSIIKKIQFEGTIAEHVSLKQTINDKLFEDRLWLFSRMDEGGRRYSVGYFLDKNGHLFPAKQPAFCFFPTKEVTGLNFIIHGPFLLTDSREGIRAGVPHNDNLIQALARLSADALLYLRDIGLDEGVKLIDDSIIDIIPFDKNQFSEPKDKRKVSFLPFFDSIKDKLSSECILPASEGYVDTKNAYWASVQRLPQLFNTDQLRKIVDNEAAKWVFKTLSRDEVNRNNKALFFYLDDLVRANINEEAIIKGRSWDSYYSRQETVEGISKEFIESQSFEWLHRFYKWLSETETRTELAKGRPVFLDQDGKAASAFDDAGQLILFLPVQDLSGYKVVHSELLKNQNTCNFLKKIGIREPSLKDQIYNIILPLYKKGGVVDTKLHFRIFFNYFCKCSNDEVDSFIEIIRDCEFLMCSEVGKVSKCRGDAKSMYMPTPELKQFFETKGGTRFLDIEEYQNLIDASQKNRLMNFLSQLGVESEIKVIQKNIEYREGLPSPRATYGRKYDERTLDGCREILDWIVTKEDRSKSLVLWNQLLKVIETKCHSWKYPSLDKLLSGNCYYFYRTDRYESFSSSDATRLKESKWLVNIYGEFVSPENVAKETLSNQYETASETAQKLLDFLGIKDSDSLEKEGESNLTDAQKEKIRLADKFYELGLSESDFEEFAEFKRQKEERNRTVATHQSETTIPDREHVIQGNAADDGGMKAHEETGQKLHAAKSRIVEEIVQRAMANPSKTEASETLMENDRDVDQDEYTPAPVDYSKRIERVKQKSAGEIGRIAFLEELQTKVSESKKYSYGWFKALLELECFNSGEAEADRKEITISFAKVEREPETKRTLVLKHPDRYIPQFLEELADIPLVLHLREQTKPVAIEVASIKSYTLRVKLKNSVDIEGVDLSSVTSATISAKSPAFLLEELRKQFIELGFKDDYDMQANLCKNIEFVFGPPGTGKTTHLARNVLIPMMRNYADCKVLVLTPTNKSADVLIRKIMEASQDASYDEWLVRFGATGDEKIEQSSVFREKTFDIRALRRNVTVTTIARFPYDFFMPCGKRIFLHGINWDYIVIDEASMIPVASIVFPLYKKTPKKFIIAGDPFQIEPIVSVDFWRNENIYTMVQLKSFANPKTVPHEYRVNVLKTQYRSVPDIGRIFGEFAYDGVLEHYRKAESQKVLKLGKKLTVGTVNIIKFPVSKYESIYRCKRLQHGSSYQIYSALFTFEYVCFLSKLIAQNNPGSLFKIGVIAPYRAQADMLDKLLASEQFPKEVAVQAGTIHGFQGDECDIVFAVFNTPPVISELKSMFLNNKNIINVSISRARDYLFIVMPDDNTENINNIRLVKRVEKLARGSDACKEFLSPMLEKVMFGDHEYLEKNSFSTSHQSVNIYGLPEKRYEVRTEESAVDVQIYKSALPLSSAKEKQKSEPPSPKGQSSHADPNRLVERLSPKELRVNTRAVLVRGAINGWCHLVPFESKLQNHTEKPTVRMFIPLLLNGSKKTLTVSVAVNDRIIYVPETVFRFYEKALGDLSKIYLTRSLKDCRNWHAYG